MKIGAGMTILVERAIYKQTLIKLLSQHVGPGRDRPLGLEQFVDSRFGLLPEGIGIWDDHLHALSLEFYQDGCLACLDLVVGPLL